MVTAEAPYPARLDIDYPDRLDRLSTFFRLLWAIPILVILALITSSGSGTVMLDDQGETVREGGGSIAGGIAVATALMILVRQRYPRWWFDFQLALARFGSRIGAYVTLMRDEYPSTEDEQAVHLDLDYPDASTLNRWLPLVKWLLAIPHYIVLAFLLIGVVFAVLVAWFAILVTGRYPRALFDYVLGVGRWCLRVQAYAFFMLTDRYPPFSLR
ncbi:MAG: DUF4389 domain-containing protein [Dehalococcoidia bacterium]|nr:DUF4389 domain-containing protein [Dehalococcoidia bacterium]